MLGLKLIDANERDLWFLAWLVREVFGCMLANNDRSVITQTVLVFAWYHIPIAAYIWHNEFIVPVYIYNGM